MGWARSYISCSVLSSRGQCGNEFSIKVAHLWGRFDSKPGTEAIIQGHFTGEPALPSGVGDTASLAGWMQLRHISTVQMKKIIAKELALSVRQQTGTFLGGIVPFTMQDWKLKEAVWLVTASYTGINFPYLHSMELTLLQMQMHYDERCSHDTMKETHRRMQTSLLKLIFFGFHRHKTCTLPSLPGFPECLPLQGREVGLHPFYRRGTELLRD